MAAAGLSRAIESMNPTRDTAFDYQTYMRQTSPNPRQIQRGADSRHKRRDVAKSKSENKHMSVAIVQNRIQGTRITVWDVLHYLETEWSHAEIAEILNLTEEQVAVATRYIEEHKDELMSVHRQIEACKARGNPPKIVAKTAKSRARLQDWLKQHHDTSI